MKHLAKASILLLLLAACGGSAKQFDSVRSLSAALADKGYVCQDLNVSTDLDKGDTQAIEGGTCSLNGQGLLSLRVWKSPEKFQEDLRLDRADRGKLENNPVLGEVWQVNGSNWMVESGDKTLTEKIADKLGGDVERVY